MDPNKTLKNCRIAAMNLLTANNNATAVELAETFEALDQWLSKGGFPPAAWTTPKDCKCKASSTCETPGHKQRAMNIIHERTCNNELCPGCLPG